MRWLCLCDCGTEKIVRAYNLNLQNTNSCGCLRNTQGALTRKHKLWRRWANIVDRCTKPANKDFHNYGERGIAVCDRWRSFQNFLEDMEASYFEGASVERINNEKGYSPDNCKWDTAKSQGRNKRNSHFVESPWGRITLPEAAERMNISQGQFKSRIKAGWTHEELFDPRYAKKLHRFYGRLRP